MKFSALALSAALMGALAVPALVGVSSGSYEKARPVLDAGIKAQGGLEALKGVRLVSRRGGGTAWAQGQSLRPGAALETRTLEVKSSLDYAGGRSSVETVTTGTGILTGRNRTVLLGDSGFGYNLVTNVLAPLTPAGL